MRPISGILGILQPVGGGDPIPLTKPEMIVGRRPGCDIRLDYENISGKHCTLRFLNGLWMVKDLGSTNGTTVNGSAARQRTEPDARRRARHRRPHVHDRVRSRRPRGVPERSQRSRRGGRARAPAALAHGPRRARYRRRQAPKRATRAPNVIERVSADEAEFDDVVPQHFKTAPKPKKQPTDDDFFKLIEDDVKEPE